MTDAAKQADDIAELKRKLVMLEKAVKPAPMPSEQEAKEWAARQHANAEARASIISPEIVRDWAVIPDDVVKGFATRDCHAPLGPSAEGIIPTSQQLSNVRVGGGTGWRDATPLGPQPGINHVDQLMDEQDRRDRADLEQRLKR
jgi:hypothetical protein